MAATLEIHFLMLKYTHCQFCQNYPKKVAKIKLILAKLAFVTNYEVCSSPSFWECLHHMWALTIMKHDTRFFFRYVLGTQAKHLVTTTSQVGRQYIHVDGWYVAYEHQQLWLRSIMKTCFQSAHIIHHVCIGRQHTFFFFKVLKFFLSGQLLQI